MKEKIYNALIYSLCLLSLGAVVYVGVKYLLPVLTPFLIAWLVVAITKEGSETLADKIHAPRKIVRLVVSLISVLCLWLLVGVILWQSISALLRFLTDLGEENPLFRLLEEILASDRPILSNILPEELAALLGNSLSELISSALTSVGALATRLAADLPTAFLFLLVTLISIIYLSLDYEKIRDFLLKTLPTRIADKLSNVRHGIVRVMGKYLRSYALILLITYGTLLLGLVVLRVEHSPIIALLIAFLDILPVIGVGTVLLPWSVVSFALGDRFLGIGLILLFVVNAVLRQFIEPKIVGKNLNLHPIVSLGAIYVGYALFGFVGLFILPMAAVAISAMLKNDSSTKIDEGIGG